MTHTYEARMIGISARAGLLGATGLVLLFITSLTFLSAVLFSNPFELFQRRPGVFSYVLLLVSVVVIRILLLFRPKIVTIESKGLSVGRDWTPSQTVGEVIVGPYSTTYAKVRVIPSRNSGTGKEAQASSFYIAESQVQSFIDRLRETLPSTLITSSQTMSQKDPTRIFTRIIAGLVIFNIGLVIFSKYNN